MAVKLLNGYIMIKHIKENVTAGGIVIPDNANLPQNLGIVLEIDDSIENKIKRGDNVLFNPLQMRPIEVKKELFYICEPKDIFLVFVEDDKVDSKK